MSLDKKEKDKKDKEVKPKKATKAKAAKAAEAEEVTEEAEEAKEPNPYLWADLDEETKKAVLDFAPGYIDFLNNCKTEREVAAYIAKTALENGYKPLEEVDTIAPGDRLLFRWKNKVSALITVGEEALENGCCVVASHADSPRLDLKANPVYEADGLSLLKTHYYGGIRKYQWLAIPLAMHGVVVKKDGTTVKVRLGEDPNDPCFTITDLLPHLAQNQVNKRAGEFVPAENLNPIIGSFGNDEKKDPIKSAVLALLKEKYAIEAADFTSAELEIVPAMPARTVGLDRSMVGGYGQDDRICVYTSFAAALETKKAKHTAITIFVDKEEIGSCGNTGLSSLLLESLYVELLHKTGHDDYYTLRKAMNNSFALSADVNAAVDPNYPEVFEKMNCSFAGRGVVMTKFTGARGKSGSNDAHPEYLGALRQLFDENKAGWQIGELGKVDIGGGGTVALYLAYFGIETVDCGPAILGMHSPFEVSSKVDVYMSYKAYKAFLGNF